MMSTSRLFTIGLCVVGIFVVFLFGCEPTDESPAFVLIKTINKQTCEGCNPDEGESETPGTLSVTPLELNYPWEGAAYTLKVQTKVVWYIHSHADWVHVNRQSGMGAGLVTLSCFGNMGEDRVALITIIDVNTDPASLTLTVEQAGLKVAEEGEDGAEGEVDPYEGESSAEGEEAPTEGESAGEGEVSPTEGENENVAVEMVSVPTQIFMMGRSKLGDDKDFGMLSEDPPHQVVLNEYEIGKYPITNEEFAAVLTWAQSHNLLYSDTSGTPWSGRGSIYAGGEGARYMIFPYDARYHHLSYRGGRFWVKTQAHGDAEALPTLPYSMNNHPVVQISWYGAVACCNWLSTMNRLSPCYDLNKADWPQVILPPQPGGFRLPTEAEWECAAAWNGSNHQVYGFKNTSAHESAPAYRCNTFQKDGEKWDFVNPMGLLHRPYTSPVGWFNGSNISPNGQFLTEDSPSPWGAYDMSGNVWEWCQDRYGNYLSGDEWNPLGPATGKMRVARGGSWASIFFSARTAQRASNPPETANFSMGFRVARSPSFLR